MILEKMFIYSEHYLALAFPYTCTYCTHCAFHTHTCVDQDFIGPKAHP